MPHAAHAVQISDCSSNLQQQAPFAPMTVPQGSIWLQALVNMKMNYGLFPVPPADLEERPEVRMQGAPPSLQAFALS